MGVPSWSLSAALNAVADRLIPANDGASARTFPGLIRAVMAAVRALADDRGGAITTGGSANAYTAWTASGLSVLRPGTSILVRIDRENDAGPTLDVDGLGPFPWCNRHGAPLGPGLLAKDRFLLAIWDDVGKFWLSDVVYELTLEYFDSQMRAWWLSLPSSPEGIGPNAPWRNGNAVSWTEPTEPIISPESPAGRRLTMRLIRDALPTSPVGLAPGDAWLNGETIAFVPSA